MIFKSCKIWRRICILSNLMLLNSFFLLILFYYLFIVIIFTAFRLAASILCFLFIWPPPRDPSIARLLLLGLVRKGTYKFTLVCPYVRPYIHTSVPVLQPRPFNIFSDFCMKIGLHTSSMTTKKIF